MYLSKNDKELSDCHSLIKKKKKGKKRVIKTFTVCDLVEFI